LVAPWGDGHWSSHYRRELALAKTSTEAEQVWKGVPPRFTSILAFGGGRVLTLLCSERDALQKEVMALADHWHEVLTDGRWNALPTAHAALKVALEAKRRAVDSARQDVPAPDSLDPTATQGAIERVRRNLAALKVLKDAVCTSELSGLRDGSIALSRRTTVLAAKIDECAPRTAAPLVHRSPERHRAAAEAKLDEARNACWDYVAAPCRDDEPLGAFGLGLMETQATTCSQAEAAIDASLSELDAAARELAFEVETLSETTEQLKTRCKDVESTLQTRGVQLHEEIAGRKIQAWSVGLVSLAGMVAAATAMWATSGPWGIAVPVGIPVVSCLWILRLVVLVRRDRGLFAQHEEEAKKSLGDIRRKLAEAAQELLALEADRSALGSASVDSPGDLETKQPASGTPPS
jgi:hypothetical protein